MNNFQVSVAYLLGLAVAGTAVVWYADLFWRYVDMPTVKFARWVENRMTLSDEVET